MVAGKRGAEDSRESEHLVLDEKAEVPWLNKAVAVGGVILLVAAYGLFDYIARSPAPSAESSANAWQETPFNRGEPPRLGISTSEAGISSWGWPASTRKITSEGGVTEFWHYSDSRVLMFRDDRLVSISE